MEVDAGSGSATSSSSTGSSPQETWALLQAQAKRLAGPQRQLVFEIPASAERTPPRMRQTAPVKVRCASCHLRFQFKYAAWSGMTALDKCLCHTPVGGKVKYQTIYARQPETELQNIATYLAREKKFRLCTALKDFTEGRVSVQLECLHEECGGVTTVKTNRLTRGVVCAVCGAC